MLYTILKNIIDTTLIQYTCQGCQKKIEESSLQVSNISDTSITLDITCPHCASQARIQAELASVDHAFFQSQKGQEILHNAIKKGENAIKDSDIQNVAKSLDSTQSISDLLS